MARYHFLYFPSIGAVHESDAGELKSSLVHETLSEDDPHINWLSYDGEKWNWEAGAYPGQHPGMSAYGLELMTVWTNYTLGLPYLIKNQHWDPDELVAENRESLRGKTINLRMLVLPEYQTLLQNYITRVDIREYSNQMMGEQLVVESSLNEQNRYIPKEFGLNQNYPNPFNPSTTISFDLPKDVNVKVDLYDVAGRKIRTLVDEPREAGSHQVTWNGQDDHGNSVASGVYVYRLQAGVFVQTKKLLFMK